MTTDACNRPIFVFGLVQRTGTELARMLLERHPECHVRWPEATGNEDWLLHESDALEHYVRAVARRWKPAIGEHERRLLLNQLGDGIIRYLQQGTPGGRTVVKTPSVRNLERFVDLFPHGRAIVMVRDGRDTVDSAVRTFGWSYAGAMRRWSEGADVALGVASHAHLAQQVRIVRYEDLAQRMLETLPDMLRFCGLAVDAYDFDAALRTPVRGSSALAADGDPVDWKPRDRPPSFRAGGGWREWNPYRHALFETVAGRQQRALGYETTPLSEGSPSDILREQGARLEVDLRRRGRRLQQLTRAASGLRTGALHTLP